jgi:hypothetical protein
MSLNSSGMQEPAINLSQNTSPETAIFPQKPDLENYFIPATDGLTQ